MNDTLDYETIERLIGRFRPSRQAAIKLYLSTSIAEQFRFPRTKKRRIRRKWANRVRNWRIITDRAFQLPDGRMVCHPLFAEKLNALEKVQHP